jgi:hypothetical protein
MPKYSELSGCVSSFRGVFSGKYCSAFLVTCISFLKGAKPRCFRKEVDEVLDKYESLKTDQAKTTFLAERREFVICRDKDLVGVLIILHATVANIVSESFSMRCMA